MELIISTAEELWSHSDKVEEIVILDIGGETSITRHTGAQLRLLRSCLLFCTMESGESMWCALSCGVMSINAAGRVLITTRDIILFPSKEESKHTLDAS